MTEGEGRSTHHGIRFIKGEVVQRVEYTPFGRERYVLHPELSEGPRFTGQTYDMEDGLYYYKARYYDPALGRFIQPDPILASTDSQSLNRYSYALNNPLKYIDPTGKYIEGPNGERYRDVDAALRDIEANEAKDRANRGDVLEGSGTAGEFEFNIPGAREFHFEGLDRDLDGDYDVVDRVIEAELAGGPGLDVDLISGFVVDEPVDIPVGFLVDKLTRSFGVAVGAEAMAHGAELIGAGTPMLAAWPLGTIAGAILIVHGLGLIAFGTIVVTESANLTNITGINDRERKNNDRY